MYLILEARAVVRLWNAFPDIACDHTYPGNILCVPQWQSLSIVPGCSGSGITASGLTFPQMHTDLQCKFTFAKHLLGELTLGPIPILLVPLYRSPVIPRRVRPVWDLLHWSRDLCTGRRHCNWLAPWHGPIKPGGFQLPGPVKQHSGVSQRGIAILRYVAGPRGMRRGSSVSFPLQIFCKGELTL